MILHRGKLISLLINSKISVGMLLGSVALDVSSWLIISRISVGSQGLNINEIGLGSFKN